MLGFQKIYSDILVSATELNRQPGRILDLALKSPITITRNDEAFALLRREDAARMVEAATHIEILVEFIQATYRLLLGQGLESEHSYSWLSTFDVDELNELLVEVNGTIQEIFSGDQPWEAIDILIHEWQESAQAIASLDLASAIEAASAEEPLLPLKSKRPLAYEPGQIPRGTDCSQRGTAS